MLQSELVTRLVNWFEDPSYYTSIDFNDSIQDGYDEAVAFSGAILKGASTPFVNNLSYYDMLTLFPDYIGVVAMFNTTTKRWMWPTSVRKLENTRVDWDTAPGTPYYFVPISHRYVAIYKKPNTNAYGNMFLYYRAAAPTLASSDTIQLPSDHVLALQDYCITDLFEQAQEWAKAQKHFQAYAMMLEKLRVWAQNQRMPDRSINLK